MLSLAEENYLKTIYHLSDGGQNAVLTNALADAMSTKPASVTDMIKRLSAKELITYEKYYGVNITKKGKVNALMIIRKHRLWETFLVEKLTFEWDQVHDVAEQLEHIQSPLLIEKLDTFLGNPKVDPHGHPIPDRNGKITAVRQIPLADHPVGKKTVVQSVRDGSPAFLQYLSKVGISIGSTLKILDRIEFDGSLEVQINGKDKVFISKDGSLNLLVTA